MGWVFLFVIEGLSVLCDLRSRKIPNALLMCGCLLGFSWQLTVHEVRGIFYGTAGALTALLILGLLHQFRMLGAGDIKLFMVTGIFLGPAHLVKLIIFSFLIAAVLAMAALFKHRMFLRRLNYLFQYIQSLFQGNAWEPYIKDEYDDAYLHFSAAILLGSILLLRHLKTGGSL